MTLTEIDFMSKRKHALIASCTLLAASLVSLATLGMHRGLDFTGGSLIEVGFESAMDPDLVRKVLAANGFENSVVQNFGTQEDILVRVPPQEGVDQSNISSGVHQILESEFGEVELRRSEFVGPAVGEELTEKGGLALLVALGVVMLYIMLRFTGKFALGAVAALIHDVVIVIGLFSIFQWTFNLPELAALLAVIGYSLNDTIVVSDRIRENFRKMRKGTSLALINQSLNQILGRTLVTSLTTLLVLMSLLVVAPEQVAGFARALTIGVIVGTYSSIYVAASVLIMMNIAREEFEVPQAEGADSDPVA